MQKSETMTPRQRELARHALGLPNHRMRSYRNYYTAPYVPGSSYDDWSKMRDAGLASRALVSPNGKRFRFWLTKAGAEAALDPGETLDPEDFPERDS